MLLSRLEATLNRNIAASSAARAACKRLDDRALVVRIVAAPEHTLAALSFKCKGERLFVTTAQSADAPAATLSGTPLAYLSMVGNQESALRTGAVRIEGDAEAAQAFRDLLAAAQPDFEEELARVIGDVGAHQIGKLARGVLSFGKQTMDTLAQNVSEYLQEESRDTVTRIEMDEFVAAVDELRDAVERGEARLNQLAQQLR